VEARTLNGLGVLAGDEGAYPRARAWLEQALRVYRDLGDVWFESMVLNNLGLIASYQGDLAVAQAYLEQSLSLAQRTGHRRMFGSVPARLGDIAYYQGQYALARERYHEALPHSRAIADRRYEIHSLCRLGLVASVLGEHAAALAHGEEALALARLTGQPRSQAFALMTLGNGHLGLGRMDEAIEAYGQAARLRQQIGQRHLAVESRAALARVELAHGALPAALGHAEEILAYLQHGSLDGTDERFRIYLTAYQVLRAADDSRAGPLLERAMWELRAQAQAIEDEAARRSFLENVPWHRTLAELSTSACGPGAQPVCGFRGGPGAGLPVASRRRGQRQGNDRSDDG
jgi:tetratricopeptide (TPR) repeat protein